MAGPVHWGCLTQSSPRRVAMLRTASLYPLCREFERHLPSVPARLRQGLALWVKGTLLAHNGCQDAVAAALEAHGRFETVRRDLREWTCDDADRILSWGPETEVDAAACLRRLLARNRLWARVWLTPVPGPDLASGLRCLSPPVA